MTEHVMPYVPIDPKGWRLVMGLRPLEISRWLECDALRDEQLALKRQLLNDSYNVVVATTPAGNEASEELLEVLRAHLEHFHPGLSIDASASDHPVVAASRLVQEDLCVLVRSDAWRLEAACVCFPSRWNLATKIGTTLDDIHGPVHRYDEQLAQPTNAVFDRMTPDRPYWRLNWTLIDNAELHLTAPAARSNRVELCDWYFRVERQTLRQLPTTKAIVFTIRTYVASASSMCDADPEFGGILLHALATAPPEMQEYKGWRGLAERLRSQING